MGQQVIDLSLDSLTHLKKIQTALNLFPEKKMTVITVAGTNGKGSTCAFLEHILYAGHYQIAAYSSPHIQSFNERLRINTKNVNDEMICQAFSKILNECQAQGIELSYFEFTTLACVYIACFLVTVDVLILEVGLGGRLDATNIFNPHAAIITSIDLDHQAYLGDTREKIAVEKAGIYRKKAVNIYAENNPPYTILEEAKAQSLNIIYGGQDYTYQSDQQQWRYKNIFLEKSLGSLPHPALQGMHQLTNASAAITALLMLEQQQKIAISVQDIKRGLVNAELTGRFQVLAGQPCVVLDVAHNPHASRALMQNLDRMGFYQHNYAVFSALMDKDIEQIIAPLLAVIDEWHIAPLEHPRGFGFDELKNQIEALQQKHPKMRVFLYPSIAHAYQHVQQKANLNQIEQQAISRLVIFGSFHTVQAVIDYQKTGVLPTPRIKSFARRNGRITERQQYALAHIKQHLISYSKQKQSADDLNVIFQKKQPIILEIGFGMGQATAQIALENRHFNYIGIEVHTAGVGALSHDIEDLGLTNLKIIHHDAVEVLMNMLPDAFLAGVHIYFPDPWHKKKHHKRRIIQKEFVELLASKISAGGYLHCATDWQPYAEWMLAVLNQSGLHNQNPEKSYSDRGQRPLTKFEKRGLKLGHEVFDLKFIKNA
jgi:dihydrofolate synthase / folylpolyglutamate synthase